MISRDGRIVRQVSRIPLQIIKNTPSLTPLDELKLPTYLLYTLVIVEAYTSNVSWTTARPMWCGITSVWDVDFGEDGSDMSELQGSVY